MRSPKLQHWLLCRGVEVVPTPLGAVPHTLFDVSYSLRLADDVGYSRFEPHSVQLLCLFTRFFGGEGSIGFEIAIRWLDDPRAEGGDVLGESYGPINVYFPSGLETKDYVFRLRNVAIYEKGRYELSLHQLSPRRKRPVLAVEYFRVE